MPVKKMIKDKYGRRFRTLRLSIVNVCNFQCIYCVPLKKNNQKPPNSLTPTQYIEIVQRICEINPLETVRLTGGEPSIYPRLNELISGLKKLGIPNIKMTTNGMRLKASAKEWKESGLDSVNVSIDAIEPEIARRLSRHPHAEKALEGIPIAQKHGLKVKVNCTVWRGINDKEILHVFRYFSEQGVTVRYLELMNMGHLYKDYQKYLYPQNEILKLFSVYYDFHSIPHKPSATANYWSTKEHKIFGIIANHSQPFCGDCDRLRLDSQGKLYGCLSSPTGLLLPETKKELEQTLCQALAQKQALHFQGSKLSMLSIGG